MHIHTYIHTYTHMHTHTHAYMHTHTHSHTHTHTLTHPLTHSLTHSLTNALPPCCSSGQITTCDQIDQQLVQQQRRPHSSTHSSTHSSSASASATPHQHHHHLTRPLTTAPALSGSDEEARQRVLQSFLQLNSECESDATGFLTRGAVAHSQLQLEPPLQPSLSEDEVRFMAVSE